MGRLQVKFHEDRCKGEAVMRFKPFYLTAQSLHCDLDLWPFDPKVNRAHAWLMGGLHVKFHEDRWKGEAVMRLKPFYLTARLQTDRRTDGRTDGQGDSSIPPPNFVAGGIIRPLITGEMPLQQRSNNPWILDNNCMRYYPDQGGKKLWPGHNVKRKPDGQTDKVIPIYP